MPITRDRLGRFAGSGGSVASAMRKEIRSRDMFPAQSMAQKIKAMRSKFDEYKSSTKKTSEEGFSKFVDRNTRWKKNSNASSPNIYGKGQSNLTKILQNRRRN